MRYVRVTILLSDAPTENYDTVHVPTLILADTLFLVPVATFVAE